MKEKFYEWLDDFIKRKEIDLNETFEINVDGVNHSFYYQNAAFYPESRCHHSTYP